MQFSDKEVSDG